MVGVYEALAVWRLKCPRQDVLEATTVQQLGVSDVDSSAVFSAASNCSSEGVKWDSSLGHVPSQQGYKRFKLRNLFSCYPFLPFPVLAQDNV